MRSFWALNIFLGTITAIVTSAVNDLGHDWVESQDLNEMDHWRTKRAAGYLIDDVVVNMTEIARQTLGEEEMNIGDSITFYMEIDLPGLAISEKTDMVIEIFGLKPDTGIAGFHICQAHMIDPRGSNIKAVQDYPYYTETNMLNYPNLVEKTRLQFQQVHTNNISDMANNKIGVQFQAVMVPTPGMVNGEDYYITAGTEYGEDTYVWVGQAKMTANLIEKIYEAKVELKNPPTSMSKGSSALFVIEAFITDPAVSIDFGTFQPLGYSDLFHIGQITFEIGNAFACSDPKYWKDRYLYSPTELSVVNASLTYPMLINREADRLVTEEKNKMVFYVPIHVLNVDTVTASKVRSVAFGLKIGNSKLWTALHEVEILPFAEPGSIGTVSIDSNLLLNNLTLLDGIVVGDAAIFKVKVEVPSGWANFDIEMDGLVDKDIFPVGVRIIKSGAIGYFPPEWLVKTRNADESLVLEYSNIQNTSPDPTTVVLELSFSTRANSTPEGSNTVSATIGGQSLSLTFSTTKNNNSVPISFEADDIGWDDQFYVHGQAALNVRVTIPSTAGKNGLYLEAVPDFDQTEVSARICQLRILQVGLGLPCLRHRIRDNPTNFNRSHPDRPFYDFASLYLGQTCPASSIETPDDNDFLVQIVYELPPQESITTGTDYKISAGFKIDESTIWVSTREMVLQSTSLESSPIESAYSTTTTPFVTSYPIVSTQDRSTPVLKGNEVFFIQYLIKTQKGTRGHYVFTILPSPSVKVCKLEIVHIGANMPCAEPPGPSITGYENMVIEYGTDSTLAHAYGEPAKLILKGLTNWGRSNMIPDLTPDADSLQIRVFFQAKEDIGSKNETISHLLSPGSEDNINGSHTFEFIDEPFMKNVTTLPSLEVKSMMGSNTSIWKHVSKVMHIDVAIPNHFYADLWLDVIHENMAEHRVVDFCSIALIEVGENLPCVRKNDDYNVTYLEDPQYIKIYHNQEETVHGGVQIKIPAVCYMAYSDKPDASKLTFLLAIRVRDVVADGEVLNLKLVAKSENTDEATHAIQMIALTVETPNEVDISTSNITVDEVKVEPDPLIGPEMVVSPGRSVWVPFHIYLPPEKIVAMEASVLLPSDGGKAIFHAVDMKFGISAGQNILCTGLNSLKIDLRRAYETTIDQSQNVTTFMQKDSITTNLGFVQNAGLTVWQEAHNDTDDKFVIEVEVQLADHILAITDAIFTVTFAVKFGSIIVIAEQTMKVDRSLSQQFGRLIIDGQLLGSNTTFNTMDIIHVESLIYHDVNSFIEGYPTKIRVITPKHIALTESNIVKANYSLNHSSDDALMIPDYFSNETLLGGFDIEFPQGISFPDIISLNLSLTVDPENIRQPGSAEELTTIVLSPICINVFDNSHLQCGSFISFEITIAGTECFDQLSINHECQVSASGLLSNSTGPFNSIGTSDAWSPPVRSGYGWNPYLEFDFLGVARVNRLTFQVPAGSAYRQIAKVTIQASNVPGFFTDVIEVAPGPEINFAQAIVARYFRIVVSDLDSLHWDEKPIGINSVQWYGCMPKEFEANANLCQSSPIAVFDERTHNRHFAFDEPQNIVYVCDFHPQMDMVCYSSDRNDGSNIWTELPRYISYIEGYSATTGRMYFRETKSNAVLSSANGKLVQLNDELPQDLEPARAVLGNSLPNFVDVSWPTGIPKGTYHGINLEADKIALQWSSCCS